MNAHHQSPEHTETNSGGCGGHAPKPDELAAVQGEEVTECLVMLGTPVIKSQAEQAGLFRDYEGQRYWFCCASCGPLFDADPERYTAA